MQLSFTWIVVFARASLTGGLELRRNAALTRASLPAGNADVATEREEGTRSSFSRLVEWMRANGAYISENLAEGTTWHGGSPVRGLVNRGHGALKPEQALLRVPKRLMLVLENFPSVADAELGYIPACRPVRWKLDQTKLLAGIAIESTLGESSFYAPWLSMLPTLEDFASFHPAMAKEEVLQEFPELVNLELFRSILDRKIFDDHERCIEAWQKESGAPEVLKKLRHSDIGLAYMWLSSRAYGFGDGGEGMVPLSDLGNTGPTAFINVNWKLQEGEFAVTTHRNISDGAELFESYNLQGSNDHMMKTWGIYLELNKNPLDTMGSAASCTSGLRDRLNEKLVASDTSSDSLVAVGNLVEVPCTRRQEFAWCKGRVTEMTPEFVKYTNTITEETSIYNTTGNAVRVRSAPPLSQRAPRCREDVLTNPNQGPLRCSLARLAWEHCAPVWGLPAPAAVDAV